MRDGDGSRGIRCGVITKLTIIIFAPTVGFITVIKSAGITASRDLAPAGGVEVIAGKGDYLTAIRGDGIRRDGGERWILGLVVFVGLVEGVGGVIWVGDEDVN